jgi:hypothetical protein
VLKWEEPLDAIRDSRRQPRIPTSTVVRSVVVMFLARLGSLNAMEQSKPSGFWRKWLGRPLPSADTVGRVCAGMELEGIRAAHRQIYSRLKSGKALRPLAGDLMAAVLDGHESHATYRRCCEGCLTRVIHTAEGDRIQYYHRHVTLQLLARDQLLLLDAEPIRPGEGDVEAAIRLLERVLQAYPRAFDVVLGDSLYANSVFFNYVLGRGKDVLAVFKDENRDPWEDAQSLFEQMSPTEATLGKCQCLQWDIEGFGSWPQVCQPVRVVRSIETRTIRRQLDRREETLRSDWMWVTTLPSRRAGTGVVVRVGHARWKIENEGFNEQSNRQHADHVYKHDARAILVFCLFAMLCQNVFQALYRRDLKPALRARVSMVHVARQIAAELYQALPAGPPRAPT